MPDRRRVTVKEGNVEQRVDLAQESVRVGLHGVEETPLVVGLVVDSQAVDRAEEQRQRSAQLVADVRMTSRTA